MQLACLFTLKQTVICINVCLLTHLGATSKPANHRNTSCNLDFHITPSFLYVYT